MKFLTAPPRVALAAVATSALCASLLVASPATAAPDTTTLEAARGSLSAETSERLEAAIDRRTDTFDGAAARKSGVPSSITDDFATGWVAAGKSATNAVVDSDELAAARRVVPDVRACAGRNRWDYTGIQLNVYLNSCNTTRVIGLINTGSGVATLAAAITAFTGLGVAIAGALAGVLGIAGGVLTTCSARGRGIVIHNIPPGPVVWCNGQ
ncbi:hypothetical protein [Curtobacterium sp. L1-20]|jgi:hypothetical protein|uniref:hypothetical protein n=1 Tax=Curtobacterium sp. L1-20 TaxID=3138181 RepID=UPI003B51947C